jgi:acyl carrier protein
MQPFIDGIQTVLYKKLNINPKLIHSKTDFRKDMELTDWEITYLFNSIEQNFEIVISEKDAMKIKNVQHLVNLLKKSSK